jgi:DNA-binding NarL/FixJ family response regulator
MSSVRVGALSDHRLFWESLSRIIVKERSFRLVAVTADTLVKASGAVRPQILLLDSRLSGALGLCRRCAPAREPRIIFVAVADDDASAADALIAGARGILYRSARAKDVVKAVTLVHEGKIFAPRHVVAAAWDKCRPGAAADERIAGWQRLSAREREVLRYAAAGLSNKALADQLAISEATVKAHLTHVFQKLGCRSRTELAAAYHGILPLDGEHAARRRAAAARVTPETAHTRLSADRRTPSG